jgi:urease accessory protein
MRASARLVVEADPLGKTRIIELTASAPLGMRMTRDALYLIGTAQGLVGDDDLELEITVRRGATLHVRSVAATIAYASNNAHLRITCFVETGGHLGWRPEPIIATHRCRVRVSSHIYLTKGATLEWNEECLLGRCNEEPGDLDLVCNIDYDHQPLLRHQLRIGSEAGGWDGPAGIGGYRAVGYCAFVGEDLETEARHGKGWAACNLDGPGFVISALATNLLDLREQMEQARGSYDHASVVLGTALADVR